ncbi:MAG: hypothetical protein IKE24_11165 [Clostridia bacterium]|nr:hypothetical protein [Clostridia bacterium]
MRKQQPIGGEPKKQQTPWEILLQSVKHLCLHNWGFKVLAIVISILIWAGLISQDETLTREKTFTDVSVNISGTDNMKRNGYIVTSDLSEALEDVTAVAAVPQQQYDRAEASAYNIRVDLNRISGTGEQELRLLSTTSAMYGRVTSLNPESVKVQVDDYIFRYRIPVSVSVTGETPSGWYLGTPTVDTPLVAASGPRSLLNSISRARVFLDTSEIQWEEGTAYITGDLHLYNRSGEAVESNLLEISYDGVKLDSVVLEISILPTRTFDTETLIKTINQVADGYEVRSLHISPESITVAARSEVLSQVSELSLSEHYVDLKELTETTSYQIKVNKPSEDAILNNDTISVTVEVQPVEAETEDGEPSGTETETEENLRP